MIHIDMPEKGSVTEARTQAIFAVLGECCDRRVVDGLFDALMDAHEFYLALYKLAGYLRVPELRSWAAEIARVMLYAAAEGFISDDGLARVARSGLARLPVHHFAGTEESAMLYRVLAHRGGLAR